ncbi:ATP phosphoribosyltransferase regulatory subunit [Acetivibrio straminisolvens JCM 21531]|uniref:ATP phosphoribosyltransferase regulatory subunit n=1 Tax=Acetivibrio straminisolvens JCM 21531 TaxID=1294263 RepID=W4V652_9FIRM|nr:ATP phosphoribosyltransferase regulatory subunit [Acetivibrio straminisolvens JCM 21531]
MAEWKIYTPEGVQDILQNECFFKKTWRIGLEKYFGPAVTMR